MLGAFAGFITFGFAHFAVFIFPLMMALAMSTVARWKWLPPVKQGEKARRGLGLLLLTPLAFFLLAGPIIYLLLIPMAVILTPFVLIFRSGRRAEDVTFDLAVVGVGLGVLMGYFWLLGRSLKHFTGAWHRWLFVRLVAWICGLLVVGTLLVWQINFILSEPLYSATYLGLFILWILSMLTLSRAGAIFGQWLTRPN